VCRPGRRIAQSLLICAGVPADRGKCGGHALCRTSEAVRRLLIVRVAVGDPRGLDLPTEKAFAIFRVGHTRYRPDRHRWRVEVVERVGEPNGVMGRGCCRMGQSRAGCPSSSRRRMTAVRRAIAGNARSVEHAGQWPEQGKAHLILSLNVRVKSLLTKCFLVQANLDTLDHLQQTESKPIQTIELPRICSIDAGFRPIDVGGSTPSPLRHGCED
jgi:hypothetical protein